MSHLLLIVLISLATPAWAEDVALNVNQSHTLSWHWEQFPDTSPATSFVFRCGQYVKRVLDADARTLRFGSLVEAAGTYSGCTLQAANEAGLSSPVIVPAFAYQYSYAPLARFFLEAMATLGALYGVVMIYGRRIAVVLMQHMRARSTATSPRALPEPVITMESVRAKEDVYVYRGP